MPTLEIVGKDLKPSTEAKLYVLGLFKQRRCHDRSTVVAALHDGRYEPGPQWEMNFLAAAHVLACLHEEKRLTRDGQGWYILAEHLVP